MMLANPDRPDRPVNSPKWCYQIEPDALELLRSFGTEAWEANLAAYRNDRDSLRERYAKRRTMRMIPVRVADDSDIALTPGGHSALIKAILEEFASRFAPVAQVIYVADTGDK